MRSLFSFFSNTIVLPASALLKTCLRSSSFTQISSSSDSNCVNAEEGILIEINATVAGSTATALNPFLFTFILTSVTSSDIIDIASENAFESESLINIFPLLDIISEIISFLRFVIL